PRAFDDRLSCHHFRIDGNPREKLLVCHLCDLCDDLRRPECRRSFVIAYAFLLYHSNVFASPSSNRTPGSYPSTAPAPEQSAFECFTSPGRGGANCGSRASPASRLSNSTIWISVCRSPQPMLSTSPFSARGLNAASRFALTTFSMWQKSRLCVPSA